MTTAPPEPAPFPDDDAIDFADLLRRVRRGLPKTLGLAMLGFALGIVIGLVTAKTQTAVSSMRVTFGFPGFENGTYPNGSKFQADDVRAPDVVNEAIKRVGISNTTGDLSSRIRGAISITGLVSENILEERDRLRASGQDLPAFFPDEYRISLSLPRDEALDTPQREMLLTELVRAYHEKFRRLYVEPPEHFSDAFASLEDADFTEYELILNQQIQALYSYLIQQNEKAKEFRSHTNNLSFQDLIRQTEMFWQLQMNDVLGLIYLGGLTKDRDRTLAKLDYRLRTLEDREQRLLEEEAVVTNLLTKTQDRSQNYVLATKAELAQGAQPILDQGLIDSLLANDAYNFLVREALDAGLAVKRVQAEKAQVMGRRKRMEAVAAEGAGQPTATVEKTQEALASLKSRYQNLLENVRTCLQDYARQEYADAIRISKQAGTTSWIKAPLLGAIIGTAIGFSFGLGLSLILPPPATSARKG